MKGTSLNNTRAIKQSILDKIMKETPVALHPLHWQVSAYLKSDLTDQERKIWYLSRAKYRNNFER